MKIKNAEEILREYIQFTDVNGSETVNMLPLTIVDAMEEYADQFRPKENDNWRSDFDVYIDGLNKVYNELLNDKEWLNLMQKYHKGLDVKTTLEKAVVTYWATHTGWEYKRKKKSKTLNWKSTLTKAISMSINKVWLPRESNFNNQQQVVYNKPKFLE